MRLGKILGIAAAACIALAAIAIPALAHKQKIATTTTVTLTEGGATPSGHPAGVYSGKISSPNPKCVAGRKVSFIVSQSGTLTSVKSDSAGNWKTGTVGLGADLLVVDAKTLKKNKKHKHVCKVYSAEQF